MSLFKRKKNKEQALELPKTIEDQATQSLRYMLPSLLIAIIGVLLASAVVWFNQSAHNAQQTQQQINGWGAAYTAAINQRLALLQADTKSAANNSRLAAVLQSNNPDLKLATERDLLHRADAVDVFLSPAGQAAQDHDRDAPISFAALDLLQRTESGAQPQPEALQVGQRWLLYSAAKLSGTSSAGSLLIVYDAATVFKGLPVFADAQLQVTLQQQFPNAPLQTLYSQGSMPSNSSSYSFATQHPNWTLVINTPDNLAQQSSLLSVLLFAAGLALLFTLCALYFMHLTIQRQLRSDAQTLSQTMQDWSHGKSIKPLTLNMLALQTFAKHLTHSVQTAAGKQSKPVKPAAPDDLATLSTVAPLANATHHTADSFYQPLDTDILDIDILEEDLDVFGLDQASNSAQRTTAAADVPNGIFRAYDIRGIVGQTLTTDTAYWIGRAVGSESIANGEPSVVVGRDGRLSGPDMAQALIQGLLDCGCSVIDLGMVPTPVLYFATHMLEARSGVMVTGSHNPPDYNGFKIVIAGETLANERITALHTRIVNDDLNHGVGNLEQVEMLNTYLEHIRNDVALAKPLRVVVDCGNGVGGVIGPQLLEALGCTVIPLYCEVDGTFPNHHPDPGKPENLQELIARVKSEQADIGIAFDGDADRLGVVTNTGNIIYPDRLMMLFAKDVVSRNPGADVIFDVKCSRRLSALISGYGGRPIMWKTGHSLIKAKMKETGALLAGEMSGHIFFKERWFGFDDGIYSAARLLEIISLDTRTVDQIFAAFPSSQSTPEINIEVTEDSKFEIIERLQREAKWGAASLTTLDGVRADYPKGWGLVRASNTTPMLVLRFEGDSAEDLAKVQALFREQILTIVPELNLPF